MICPKSLTLTAALALAACGGTTATDTTDDTSDTNVADDGFNGAASAADFTCFTPAGTFDAVTWATQGTPKAASTVTVNGLVNDFEQEEPRTSRVVSLWYDDTVEAGSPDITQENDSSAKVTLADTPTCQPLSWLVAEKTGLEEAKDTFKAHQIYGEGSGGTFDAEFDSVSIDTYRLIPTIVGISIDPTKGVIAGTMYDCSRDPDTQPSVDAGKVEGVRIRVKDLQGNEPTGIDIKYFVENFPDRDQPWTSEDGLWGAFNVEPGVWRVEAYAKIDGEEVVLGGTQLTTYADSINIANIYAGFPDGVKYPEACLTDDGDAGDSGGGGDTGDSGSSQ